MRKEDECHAHMTIRAQEQLKPEYGRAVAVSIPADIYRD